MTKEKLEVYKNVGINRLSIGLQSSHDEELKLIDRIHTYSEFLEVYNLTRKVGFENINVDIIIGLPNQTKLKLEETINRVIDLKPEHISVYSLILEEGTKLFENQSEYAFPDEDVERQMYWGIQKRLEREGYMHYEISNYALKGYESKHNLDCWNQKEYIGFGLDAHSYLDSKRYSNTDNFNKYIDSEIPYSNQITHEIQTIESKMKEYMILGLRKIEGVRISEFKNRFVDNPVYIFRDELNLLVEKGLIEVDIDSIKLTNKGIDLANQVWEGFL